MATIRKHTTRFARHGRRRLRACGLGVSLCAAGVLLFTCPAAMADVSGLGPDETIGQPAGPLSLGVTYSGAFNNPDDIDVLFFSTSASNTTLHITVKNTLRTCSSPASEQPCPLWATLLDTLGRQLGGEGSSAGTGEVDYNAVDIIDWTFPQAGRYIIVLESSGDLPTFQFRLDQVFKGGGTTGVGPRPKIVLTASPTKVSAGKRVRFRFKATLSDRRHTRVGGAAVRFAGRTAITDGRGRASIVVSLRRPGTYKARARKRGFSTGAAAVTAT
jgi:hypothetical protein